MEISNKSLALLLVAAMVISLGGTIVSLQRLGKVATTGFAVDTSNATTNFTITSDVRIAFTTNSVNFGTGSVDASGAGVQYCQLDTNSTSNSSPYNYCQSFNTSTQPFIIENQGNVNVGVDLASNATAAQFIGGTGPWFNWSVSNNETGACSSGLSNAAWTNVSVSPANATVCSVLQYGDQDTLAVDIRVVIPEDASQTAHMASLIAYGWA